ncbi:MAG: PIG-L deacetylase family protein [Anaerolineaceae bacterium]|nr:PIG-L deacetylase family protein [Anaerolineaceae bacterium]
MEIEKKLSLLAVLAHPDDETFGMGGTLARYAKEGVDVYLICATRGEVGEMDEEFLRGFNSIAERREYELRCAAKSLGIKEVIFLKYRDSGMVGSVHNDHPDSLFSANLEQVAEEVVQNIRRLQPSVVITFDPIGGYRHPDHIKIHEATIKAFKLASDPSYQDQLNQPPFQIKKLYYHSIPKDFLRWTVRIIKIIGKDPRKFGKNKDIDLVSIAEVHFPTHAIIHYGNVVNLRNEASACHSSQGGSRASGGLMGWLQRILGSKDRFMRAYPDPLPGEKIERDLFQGI